MWSQALIVAMCAGFASAVTTSEAQETISNPPTQTISPATPTDVRGPLTSSDDVDWDSVTWTTVVDEPMECFQEDVSQYFQFPEPTGDLMEAFHSYASKIIPTSCDHVICTAQASDWCAFSTAVPSSVAADYTAFQKSLVSWYTPRSESLQALPTDCPDSWFRAESNVIFADYRLNNTIAWAECWRTDSKEKRDQPDLAAIQYS